MPPIRSPTEQQKLAKRGIYSYHRSAKERAAMDALVEFVSDTETEEKTTNTKPVIRRTVRQPLPRKPRFGSPEPRPHIDYSDESDGDSDDEQDTDSESEASEDLEWKAAISRRAQVIAVKRALQNIIIIAQLLTNLNLAPTI
ncbi:hypothetical protein M378DRAFT_8442 [Amanita muscaria Koide BX008]|uniref:Uncharacterized protein n=1 Tax=Amanita muscaria (strain Koide BX008) TaxID=946122 RepID=A0A0C2XHV3_AMAMK|nr:hypothetical protein M378DRAFT_8442 [Amanita muscaria Koide BX008]